MSIKHLVRSNIKNLSAYSSARSEFKGQADIFLDANENPFDTGMNRYPDPLQWAVKEQISRLKSVPSENIFLGNGSDEVIDLLIRIFCEPREDGIILLPPTYGMYKVSADIADVAQREVSLTGDFQPNIPAILAEADKNTKLLFVCSPNNPTGNDMEAEKVHELCRQFPGIVIVDEAYIDFSDQESFSQQLDKYPNLVVMQTFSKAWGLAGIRLGMAFASEEIIGLLNKVKPPYNINQLTQKAALDALQKQAEQEKMVAIILQERNRMAKVLENLDFIQEVLPSNANFILVRVAAPNGLYDYLVKQGIIVRNRSNVHLCAGGIRITIGTAAENEKLIAALNKYSN
ncbi:MAG TPA: histidinol-phosphate transaminase [Saprospiraceae bacterium]|nr:histidinol-phosphate transaminase [Saprospiraceae bacterium]